MAAAGRGQPPSCVSGYTRELHQSLPCCALGEPRKESGAAWVSWSKDLGQEGHTFLIPHGEEGRRDPSEIGSHSLLSEKGVFTHLHPHPDYHLLRTGRHLCPCIPGVWPRAGQEHALVEFGAEWARLLLPRVTTIPSVGSAFFSWFYRV